MKFRRPDPRSAIALVFFAALWLGLWRQLSGEWSVNEQYSYGWFVPFFAIVLFWLRFERTNFTAGGREAFANRPREAGDSVLVKTERFEDAPKAQELGAGRSEIGDRPNNGERITNNATATRVAIGIIIVALSLLLPLRLFEIGNPDWRPLSWIHAISVITITLLFLWSIGGTPWLRHFAFPVAFTLVAVPWISPIEAPITQELMRSIAAAAAETANLLGIPAQVQGNLIQVQTGVIGVNEACSGVRSLQTSIMIGLLFGELWRLAVLRRLTLLAGAIVIALVANFLRAVFLVWIGASEGISAIDRWHDIAGYAIVVLVFVGSLALAALLARRNRSPLSVNRYSDPNNKERITNNAATHSSFVIRHSRFAAALIWLVAVEIAAAGWYRAHERDEIAMPRWSVHWPNDAPGFHELKIDEGVRSTLRYDEGAQAAWNVNVQTSDSENKSSIARCMAFFFRWKPGGSSVVRARAHRPDICLPAAGWRQISDRGVTSYSSGNDFALPFHHLAFADARGGLIAHAFFSLQEDELRPDEPRPDLQVSGGAQPDWGLIGRSRIVWNGVRNRGQQIIEVVLLSHEPLDDASAEKEFAKLAPRIVKIEKRF